KDKFDNNIIINSTAKPYISISYQKDSLSKDTRFFTASYQEMADRQNASQPYRSRDKGAR
ncbi:hypothetical protein ACTM97_16970, partial [Oliverpabstia intestinalis]|uniref:hypothetical protein n=1 Tax=Oliverpabstia intestinalis TaxID=2606633 RepID=UPI003F8B5F5F